MIWSWQFVAPSQVEHIPAGVEVRLCFSSAATAIAAERQISRSMGLGKPGMVTTRFAEPLPWVPAEMLEHLSQDNALALAFGIDNEVARLESELPNDPETKAAIDAILPILLRLKEVSTELRIKDSGEPLPQRIEKKAENWKRVTEVLDLLDNAVGEDERRNILAAGFRSTIFLVGAFGSSFVDPLIGTFFSGCIASGVDPVRMARAWKS